MYLNNTEKLQIKSNVAATTTEPAYVFSYNSIDTTGLAPLTSEGLLSGTSEVDAVGDPGASLSYQIKNGTVCNQDTVSHTITVYVDVGGTNRQVVQALLQSGETLQYNGAVWSVFSQSTQSAIVLREYIANSTWTKPAGLKYLLVFALGAGGGGGSGARNAAGNNRFGGSGGGGGAVVWRLFAASELSTSYSVSPGTAGTGGTAISVDNTNGNPGIVGGDTSFGGIVIAKGGQPGAAGSTSAPAGTAGGSASLCTPAQGPYAIGGSTGGAGQTTGSTSGGAGFSTTGGAGGAPGGGISSGNTSSTGTYNGGAVINNNSTISGPAFGVSGADNQARSVLFHPTLIGTYGLGTGGGGGRPDLVNGGNGGNYGAGGGGGSGVLNGTTSGAGGSGGGGLITVLEIF